MTITIDGTSLLAYLLAAIRILGWVALAPPFNNKGVPTMAKVVLSLGLAFAVSPTLASQRLPQTTPQLIVVVLTQMVVGAGMGFVTQLLFDAIMSAGALIDVLGGFQVAAAYDPLSMNMNSVFGRFHQMLTTALLLASGGHLIVIGGLLETFRALPLMGVPDLSNWGNVMTTAFSMFFSIAVQIALPLAAVLFISDLALALLTKIAPAMNAMNVMYPVKIGLTLMLVGLSFTALPHATDRLVDLVTQAMSTMAGAG